MGGKSPMKMTECSGCHKEIPIEEPDIYGRCMECNIGNSFEKRKENRNIKIVDESSAEDTQFSHF